MTPRNRNLFLVAGVIVAGGIISRIYVQETLLNKGETLAARARLSSAVTELHSKGCRRPVLRGESIPGSGTLIFAEVFRRNDACRRALEVNDEAMRGELEIGVSSEESRSPRGMANVSLWARLPFGLEACDPSIQTLGQAIQHAGVCGKAIDVEDGSGLGFLRRMRLMVLRAVELWRAEREAEALSLVLDAMRVSQDYGRASMLIDAVLSQVGFESPAALLEVFLNDHSRRLGRTLLMRVAAEVRNLIEGEPELRDTWVVEAVDSIRYMDRISEGSEAESDRDEAELQQAVFVATTDAFQQAFLAACPPGGLPNQCYDNSLELADTLAEQAYLAEENFSGHAWDARATRQYFLDVGLVGQAELVPKYLQKLSIRLHLLSAAALHVAVRLQAIEGCPATLPEMPDANTGEPLLITVLEPNVWEVHSAMDLGRDIRYRIHCTPNMADPAAEVRPSKLSLKPKVADEGKGSAAMSRALCALKGLRVLRVVPDDSPEPLAKQPVLRRSPMAVFCAAEFRGGHAEHQADFSLGIERSSKRLAGCYEELASRNPAAEGEGTIQMRSGETKPSVVLSGFADPVFQECVSRVASAWTLPKGMKSVSQKIAFYRVASRARP